MDKKLMICPDAFSGKCVYNSCRHYKKHEYDEDKSDGCVVRGCVDCPDCIEYIEPETREEIDKRISKFARRDKDDYIEYSIDSSDSSCTITLTLPSDANVKYPTNNYPRGL